jgi:UDP-N-acetylmuramoylalanine--D-glutamate ligase
MSSAAQRPARRRGRPAQQAQPAPAARGRRPSLPPGPYAVLGLARSGHAAALALAERGEDVIGLDSGTPQGLEDLRAAGVEIHVGADSQALPQSARAVVKSPGVPQQARALVAARQRGLPVLGELELGWRLLANPFIAVTGTNGKTTTAELVGHIHRQAGLPVAVAGNVGTALSGLAWTLAADAVVVCEASSFQLEDTLAFAPEAAVLVNLTPDHLDRHETFAAYVQAKAGAFERQRDGDLAILPSSLLEARSTGNGAVEDHAEGAVLLSAGHARRVGFGAGPAAALRERDGELFWNARPLLAATELRLRGRHNLENAMAAAAVCLARGLDAEAVRAGLRSFQGVRHRLEELATLQGVTFVNDSKATNVASTLVALQALAGTRTEGPGEGRADAPADVPAIHLILGGQGKGQDFTRLREPVARGCRAVYLIGEDAGEIAAALAGTSAGVHMCGELARAVAHARQTAAAGEVVLLSPACASFDQFSDFEARGERFRQLVCG